jgi:preprotein translocase subunit YajC
MPNINEGDTVVLRGTVTIINCDFITVKIPGYGYPITVRADFVAGVEKAKPAKDRD